MDSTLLAGIRVLDWTTMAAGPGASAVLADFGAMVTKVEPVQGDPWRRIGMKEFGSDSRGHQFGPHFDHDNRGKRSVVLDLQNAAGLEAFDLLLCRSDVLVTNVRMAGTQRLGLDFESVKARYPRLIYAHLTAWGRSGPMRDAPGYDAGAFWAASGMLDHLRASDDQQAMPRLPGGSGDHATSMSLVAGIALSLFQRERTGKGGLVDVSLLRSGLWCNAMLLGAAAAASSPADVAFMRDPGRTGPTFRAYRCRDGEYVQLLGYQTQRHMPVLLAALGLDKAPPTPDGLDAIILTKDAADWERIFDTAGVWYTRVARFDRPHDVLGPQDDQGFRGQMSQVVPQAAEIGAWINGAAHKLIANPIRTDDMAKAPWEGAVAPKLGEHTEAALREAGATDAKLAELTKGGAFGGGTANRQVKTRAKL